MRSVWLSSSAVVADGEGQFYWLSRSWIDQYVYAISETLCSWPSFHKSSVLIDTVSGSAVICGGISTIERGKNRAAHCAGAEGSSVDRVNKRTKGSDVERGALKDSSAHR
jgi:hypothetical protein